MSQVLFPVCFLSFSCCPTVCNRRIIILYFSGSACSPDEAEHLVKSAKLFGGGGSGGVGATVERKKRRATVDPDYEVEPKSRCLSPGVVATASGSSETKKSNKKKGFSWKEYLVEENAKVAAPKLFKNVRTEYTCYKRPVVKLGTH